MPYLKRLLLLCIVVAYLTSCTGATPEPPTYWPTEGWRTSTPEEQGMDSEMLADMLETIEEQDYDIDSVVVVRHGYMVVDATIFPFEAGSRHIIYSCTKSVISALIGIAIDEGYIEGVNQPALGFFPERTAANLDANKEAITLAYFSHITNRIESEFERQHDMGAQFSAGRVRVLAAPGQVWLVLRVTLAFFLPIGAPHPPR